jgi:hypothetical protein
MSDKSGGAGPDRPQTEKKDSSNAENAEKIRRR